MKSFTHPNLPSGSGPFNAQNIKGELFVAFTVPVGHGAVDIFDKAGNLVKNLTSASELKAPWGLAIAPAQCGPVSKAVLVGNLNDGRIKRF